MTSRVEKIKYHFEENYFFLISIIFLIFLTRVGYWNLVIVGGMDESTYLLTGREILNGKVPYLDFWEIKPPIAFLPYILPNLFENPILANRIIGFFIIIICSYSVFFQLTKITNVFNSQIITILFIILNSQEQFQNINLTIYIYPLLLFISHYLLLNERKKIHYFILGICVSLICLIRPNFYLLVPGIIFIITIFEKNKIKNILYYILGGLLPLICIILFYLTVDDGLKILFNFVFNLLAAGSYVDLIWNLREIIRYLLDGIDGVITISAIFLILYKFKEIIKIKENVIIIILFFCCLFSVINVFTGQFQFNNFYIYLVLVIGILVKNIEIKKNEIKDQIKIILFCSLLPIILISSIAIIKNYNFLNTTNNKYLKYNFDKSDKNSIALTKLKKLIKSNERIYSYDSFFYLTLKKQLPTKIIHPTNFKRLSIYENIIGVEKTKEKEFENILSKKIDWLIIKKDVLDKDNFYTENFKKKLVSEWKLLYVLEANDDQYIYKKIK